MDTGHWYFPTTFDISTAFGFVYAIRNKLTGQTYIGKKQFWSVTRKAVKGKKRRQVITKESDWKTYCSSSNSVAEDIRKYSESNFEFLILSLHKTKSELSYAETKTQWQMDVLRAKFPDGSKKFYNGRIERISYNEYTKDKIAFL